MADWSDKWLLRFNPDKCKVMHVGHKLNTKYLMVDGTRSAELTSIKLEKDLGVFVEDDLKPSTQCIRSAAKARRIIGMVRRTFRKLDMKDFLILYKTYIRPHIEFCIQAWSPFLNKDIEVLERVQKSATNLVSSLRKFSYPDRLSLLGLTTLKMRRTRGDLIETFKLLTGRGNIDKAQFFSLAKNEHGLRGHSMKIVKRRSRLDIRKYFFSQRVVSDWNKLTQSVVDAQSVNSFKNRLDKHWQDMDNRSYFA